jgi:hypothetical protein
LIVHSPNHSSFKGGGQHKSKSKMQNHNARIKSSTCLPIRPKWRQIPARREIVLKKQSQFVESQMNLSNCQTKDYEKSRVFEHRENKAKRTQFSQHRNDGSQSTFERV